MQEQGMYTNLIFELSKEGRIGHILPKTDVPKQPIENLIPKKLLRETPADHRCPRGFYATI